jgi:DNA repair photolyase
MKPIYEPKGRAKEYGDLSINIYTGCNHGCTYCYAPLVLKKSREAFNDVKSRDNVVEATRKQLSSGEYKDKTIHLCFTCDPYPAEIDTTPTREIIKAIKESGAHVQILTKGGERAARDFDLLDSNDKFGVTYTGIKPGYLFKATEEEPNAAPMSERLATLDRAHKLGIKTWMSCEPVIIEEDIYSIIELADYVDLFKIGKMNYRPSNINWGEFGRRCERICRAYRRNYYIKEDLRVAMSK